MQPSFAVIVAGCILLAVAAQAQTSTAPSDALPSPSQLGEPAQPGEPGQATITPPPVNDQPGNASAKGSNLSDMTITRDGTEVRETPDGGSRLLGRLDAGVKVLAIGTSGEWTHIIVGGTDGFVSSQALK
jgi:hypothetical protein